VQFDHYTRILSTIRVQANCVFEARPSLTGRNEQLLNRDFHPWSTKRLHGQHGIGITLGDAIAMRRDSQAGADNRGRIWMTSFSPFSKQYA